MRDPVRVQHKTTKHKYTKPARFVKDDETVLKDERAVDVNGRALPAETADSTQSSGANKASAKKDGGEPADTPKEGSK